MTGRQCLGRRRAAAVLLWALPAFAAAQAQGMPPGEPKSPPTRALELGSRLLQGNSPLAPMDVYLVGFHPMKEDPEHQMEAHHFCHQVNEDFAQCVLFDGNGKGANLNGIEYIISGKIFETLPEDDILRSELAAFREGRSEGSWENFLYFVARLYFDAHGEEGRAARRRSEQESGVSHIRSSTALRVPATWPPRRSITGISSSMMHPWILRWAYAGLFGAYRQTTEAFACTP